MYGVVLRGGEKEWRWKEDGERLEEEKKTGKIRSHVAGSGEAEVGESRSSDFYAGFMQ